MELNESRIKCGAKIAIESALSVDELTDMDLDNIRAIKFFKIGRLQTLWLLGLITDKEFKEYEDKLSRDIQNRVKQLKENEK